MTGYFNYISFGNRNILAETNENMSMTIDRVLEYTPSDVSSRLIGFEEDAINFMESLATFICSEINANTNCMIVKYGVISKVKRVGGKIEFYFSCAQDFGEVEFSDASEAASIFKAHSFQVHRTHWAIMAGDARDVLIRLIDKTGIATDITEQHSQLDTTVPSTAAAFGEASCVEDFLSLVFKATGGNEEEYFFRGHENESYLLAPSIMREWPNGAPKYLPNEAQMGKELLVSSYDEFENDQYCFDRLVRMQHFGLPTRLLDLTENPLVALYFACEDKSDTSGQVVILGVKKKTVKYYDSDTVSCLANLSRLSKVEKDKIDISATEEDFNASESIRQLLHFVKSEKPYFEPRIVPADIGAILCVKAKRNNIRIKSQHGAFLLFGHGAKMSEGGTEGILVKRIIISEKKKILAQLSKININAATVYPSIEASAEQVRNMFCLSET